MQRRGDFDAFGNCHACSHYRGATERDPCDDGAIALLVPMVRDLRMADDDIMLFHKLGAVHDDDFRDRWHLL